jgi:hypothetical protein
MATLINAKGRRVSDNPHRRDQVNTAIGKLRAWHDKQLLRCPEHNTVFKGMCLHAAVCAYGRRDSVPYGSVQELWAANRALMNTGRQMWNPPRGAFCIYRDDNPHDQYNRHGHVIVSNGRGKGWGVDRPEDRRVGLVPIKDPVEHWGMIYAGWIWPWELWRL